MAPSDSLRADRFVADWFLSAGERGNPDTRLDDPGTPNQAWTMGNLVRPLVHGSTYYRELAAAIGRTRKGDLLFFVDWRGDPDQQLTGEPELTISRILERAAERGVLVRGLIWRSHLDKLKFSSAENRHLGQDIDASGGICLLDMRVRPGGSHHQKFVVIRYPGRSELDVAFVGGIDLCHSRRDDRDHAGDRQPQPIAAVYGPTPPWHDVQLEIRGPAVAAVETVFRERWDDPQPLSRSPIRLLADKLHGLDPGRRKLPAQLPPPAKTGSHAVQLLRTYGRRRPGYDFARNGERSIARGYAKVLSRARRLIYLEEQYLWSAEVARSFADALRRSPDLLMIAVLPHFSDAEGTVAAPPQHVGRLRALQLLTAVGGGRFAAYGLENHAGTPVYVHAKVCVIDDIWASVGSDNVNRRSWTNDSELSAAVLDPAVLDPAALDPAALDPDPPRSYARELRLQLACEHLDRNLGDDADLIEPGDAFAAFATTARNLQSWHDHGFSGPRPPGRLRPAVAPVLTASARWWAPPLYRAVFDPDGRTRAERRARRF